MGGAREADSIRFRVPGIRPCGGAAASDCRRGRDEESAIRAGAAYVFERQGLIWSQRAKLRASDAEGAVYLFGRSGTIRTEHRKLASPADSTAFFGAAVALSSPSIVAGAPNFIDFTGECCRGNGYIFTLTRHQLCRPNGFTGLRISSNPCRGSIFGFPYEPR
jgi:hypothetical protein